MAWTQFGGIDVNQSSQREQWAEHLNDEASARRDQQAAAGPSHRPLEGPLPFSAENLERATKAAVSAERERCAGLADGAAKEERLAAAFPQFTEAQRQAAAEALSALAADMRAD
jgi:hypothetical protein